MRNHSSYHRTYPPHAGEDRFHLPHHGKPRSSHWLTEAALNAHCQEHLIRWSCPREIEFRSDLPCTLVGKVAFNTLEQQEIAKLRAEGKYCGG